jgi:CelD/BcsL family acetyltransferase involved in cellulose biosynthesis
MDFDHSVDASDVDRFCSRSEWILPFHRAFLPERDLFLYRGGRDGTSYVALASREHAAVGHCLEAVENMWCFACPLIGPDAAALLDAAIADHGPRAPLVLSGIPASRAPTSLLASVVQRLGSRYELRAVDTTLRFVASLEGGLDGFLSRRSSSFRRNLRAAARKVKGEDLSFEHVQVSQATVSNAYARILRIESASWKSAEGSGIDTGPMRAFYRNMLPRLAARGALRLIVARLAGEDVGYLYGGTCGDHFRGLQISYDQRHERLSLGNLMQHEMIQAVCEQGFRSYDLGTRSDYKRRWAEEGLETITVLARPL